MRTSELIALLQKVDPSGDTEVVIDGESIMAVDMLPAYYDGPYQMIHRNQNGRIESASIVREGFKVELKCMTIEDAMWTNEDLVVNAPTELDSVVQSWRDNVKDAKQESCYALFRQYVFDKARIYAVEIKDQFEKQVRDFYFSNLSYQDPIPKDILELRVNDSRYGSIVPSQADMKMLYWSSFLRVNFDEQSRKLEISNINLVNNLSDINETNYK